MKYSPRHVCEYVLMRAVAGFVRLLPYRMALLAGWFTAFLGHFVGRFRVAEAKRRIREVFPDRFSEKELSRIAWISWRNFVLCVIDMIRLPSFTKQWAQSYIVNCEETLRSIRDLHRDGKGAVLACPHMGSWELAGVLVQICEVPIFFITGRQKNPLVDAYINRMRGQTGIATIQRGSAMLKQVIRRLKNGEMLGFLPDVRMATEGVRVRFLGKDANVVGGMGLFARQANVPIYPSLVTRVGLARHNIVLGKPVWPDTATDKRDDWQRMTQEVFSVVEQAIRKQPEQWFWYNKRWILDPLEPSAAPPAPAVD